MDKQEMAQIMKLLLAMREDIKANQAKSDADRKTDKEQMLATMNVDREERKADHEEMMAMMKAWGETLDALSTDTKDYREETMACQGNMEARLGEEKPASVDMTPEVAHG
jgi:hypothetical protein